MKIKNTQDYNDLYWAIMELKRLNLTISHLDKNFNDRFKLNEIVINRAEKVLEKIKNV
jgi:predicted transcriptional regulator